MTQPALKILKITIFFMVFISVTKIGMTLSSWEGVINPNLIMAFSELFDSNPSSEDLDANLYNIIGLIFLTITAVLYSLIIQAYIAYNNREPITCFVTHAAYRAIPLLLKLYLGIFLFLYLSEFPNYESYFDAESFYEKNLARSIHAALTFAVYSVIMCCIRLIWRKAQHCRS